MDKMIKFLFVLILMSSCIKRHEFQREEDNLVFWNSPWVVIDLRTNKLIIEYGGLKDTVYQIFNKIEKLRIIKSFNKNEIGDLQGEQHFYDGFITMPPCNLNVKYYSKGEMKSKLVINENFEGKNTMTRRKVKKFNDEIIDIMKENLKIKEVWDRIDQYYKTEFPDVPLRI